jgi:adenylate cyclase
VILKPLKGMVTEPVVRGQIWLRSQWKNLAVIGMTSVTLTAGVMGLAQLRALEALEQKAYDQMVRLRQMTRSLPPDERLLIVTVTEADLEAVAEFPLTDGTVARASDQRQAHEPIAIGVDMFRAIPKQPGREALLRALQADNVVVITQLSNATGGPGIPPPSGVDPAEVRVNGVVVDADGKVRRALLVAEPVTLTETPFLFSFSLQLAVFSHLVKNWAGGGFFNPKLLRKVVSLKVF